MAVKWKWKPAAGGSVPAGLEQRVQNIETNYVSKNANALQNINGSIDVYGNMVIKQEGYVDRVATGPTSMINKQYLEQQLTTTKNQIRSENNTFTGANTFNTGNNLLTYTSTNTTKPDEEVLVRRNMFYARVINNNGFTINGNNGYQSTEFTITDLTTGLNEFYVVLTTSSVDIGFDIAIQVNNLNYPNSSDIKIITTSNLINSNVDNLGFVYIGFVVYGNNKFRFRAKNTHSTNITFNGFRVYKRMVSKITS